MSEIVKDRAIVLRTYEYHETSLIVVVLTREYGKLRLLARGARRAAATGMRTGNAGDIVFYFRPDRGLQALKEADMRGTVASLGDLDRLCLLQAGLELVDRSTVGREADEGFFRLLDAFLEGLVAPGDPWLIFFTLETLLLKALGVFPGTGRCSACGRPVGDDWRLDPREGSISCGRCGGDGHRSLSAGSRRLLRRIEEEAFDAAPSTTLTGRERGEIGRLLHELFKHHVEGYRLPGALRILKGRG
ncbi:MAG: DNA repair protein RecO [Candidatus Krumholzibacteriota bacterium]|nr:DNA repair protein RecO [Candidatus Krumholzibacteriota bacterium]